MNKTIAYSTHKSSLTTENFFHVSGCRDYRSKLEIKIGNLGELHSSYSTSLKLCQCPCAVLYSYECNGVDKYGSVCHQNYCFPLTVWSMSAQCHAVAGVRSLLDAGCRYLFSTTCNWSSVCT